jgi:hypothetical protein
VVEKPPNFIDRQPDIRQPETRNRAAEEIVAREARNQGIVVNEIVLPPKRCPGEDEKKNAHF